MSEGKNLGVLKVTMEDGGAKSFVLRSTTRQGDPVIELREVEGINVWPIYQFKSPPAKVEIMKDET